MTDGRSGVRLAPLLLAAILAQGLVNVDFFAMSLALPDMAADLGTTTTDLQWVISGYMIALAALFIPGGRLGDIYGRRRTLVAGLVLFGASSLLAGLSSEAIVVVALRVIQGVGAAAIFPMSIACVAAVVPRGSVTQYTGIVFGTAAIGTALGPFVGGLLTELLSWRWVFFMNTIVAALVILMVLRFVPANRDETASRRLDYWGIVLISGGVAAVTLAADVVATAGWWSVPTVGFATLGGALLVAFVLVERRVADPLLDLSLFRIREFDVLLVGGSVGNIAFVSMVLLITMQLQQVRGLSPLQAGTVFLSASIGTVVAGQISGRLTRFPAWRVLCSGLVIGVVGLTGLALVEGWPAFLVAFLIAGFGLGLTWSFPTVAAQGMVPAEKSGAVSGTVLTVLVGLAGIFLAVTATAVEGQTAGGLSFGAAISRTLIALAGFAVAGMVATALFGRQRTKVNA